MTNEEIANPASRIKITDKEKAVMVHIKKEECTDVERTAKVLGWTNGRAKSVIVSLYKKDLVYNDGGAVNLNASLNWNWELFNSL